MFQSCRLFSYPAGVMQPGPPRTPRQSPQSRGAAGAAPPCPWGRGMPKTLSLNPLTSDLQRLVQLRVCTGRCCRTQVSPPPP